MTVNYKKQAMTNKIDMFYLQNYIMLLFKQVIWGKKLPQFYIKK